MTHGSDVPARVPADSFVILSKRGEAKDLVVSL
jgi:hypothetical protein